MKAVVRVARPFAFLGLFAGLACVSAGSAQEGQLVRSASVHQKVGVGQPIAIRRATNDPLDQKAGLQVKGVGLADILTQLQYLTGVPIVFSNDFLPAGAFSCDCREISIRSALDRLLDGTGLHYIEVGPQVVIEPRSRLRYDETPAPMASLVSSPIRVNVRGVAAPVEVRANARPKHASAQGSIVGSVVDAGTSQPLSGVQVQVADVQLGAITNDRGRFLINGVPEGDHLVTAQRIGYATQSQTVTVRGGETATLDLRLTESAIDLDAVVVTAYAQSLKAAKTSAVAELDRKTIETMPITTADQALQGTVAGVQVTTMTGQPGAGVEVRVRGLGSINADNSPLYIVDGVQVSDRSLGALYGGISVLGGIDPQDIESIRVLKDAAATSIYGAQAANGVVLVTTRRGRDGATQWTFSAEGGFVDEPNMYAELTGPQWIRLQMESYGNRAVDLGQTRAQGEQQAMTLFGDPATAPTYDWPHAVRQTGQLHSFNGSVSGGSAVTRFFLSGGYNYEESQQVGTSFTRYTARANLEHQATSKMSILANVGLSSATQLGAGAAITCGTCPLHASYWLSPLSPIYNADGSYNLSTATLKPIAANPVYQVNNEIDNAVFRQVVGSLTGNYAITTRLNFRSLWGLDYRTTRTTQFFPPDEPQLSDQLSEGYTGLTNWNTNQVLSYTSTLGAQQKHSIQALAGVEYRHESLETFSATGTGFSRPSGLFHTLDLAAVPAGTSGSTGGFKVASAFGRAEYDYANRFSLSGSMRYDGSSRFGSDTRWGLFYSGSAGWNLKTESFLRDVTWLDNLKLRASYGTTGNSSIGDFAALTLYGSGGSYAYNPALIPTQLGSNVLTWEKASTVDVGVDWSTFSGRFHGSIDAVRKDNTDLLLAAYVPSDAGFSSITQNSGAVRNEGFEVELAGIPYRNRDFTWETSLTWAYYKNRIRTLEGGLDHIGNNIRVGEPLRIFWGQKWAGVNPANGRSMWYDKNGNITYTPTSSDARVIGSPLPKYEGGWTNTFTYGRVSLSGYFAYALGMDAAVGDLGYIMDTGSGGGLSTNILGRWQQPGDVTGVPKAYPSAIPGTSSFRTFSTRWVEDASYIKLKTLRLSYELPPELSSRMRIAGGSVYVAGFNLWTHTKYEGTDPEIQENQVDLGFARLSATWPPTRQIRFGVELRP